jgi:putative heme-binding domain-containing protein
MAAVSSDLTARLVEEMTQGRAPVGVLQDRALRQRLLQAADVRTRSILEQLLSALPDEDVAIRRLLAERIAGFAAAPRDLAHGREVFVAACAACHQVDGEGGLVGPQLVGIGTRGLERLCEDILAPNLNVDHAFWTTELTTRDGETLTGLFRREEGDLLVLANSGGVEFSVPKAEVTERRESTLSLMPSNFAEALSPSEFNDLLAFLLDQRGTDQAPRSE